MMKTKKHSKGVKKVLKDGGVSIEKKVAAWLDDRGFRNIDFFEKRHAGYWDIKAVDRDGKKWIIEVKGGYTKYEPSVKISNLLKMIHTPRVDKIGIVFVPKNGVPMLFELNKMSYAGLKASKTKGKKVEREAGFKAARKRNKRRR